MQIYWGDIHNHNEIGYGRGSLERSFDIAENSLDFYAFTPHTWWPDLPDNDEEVTNHHLKGFKTVVENWSKIKNTVSERNQNGTFVSLLAWEWHSLKWGDYCMFFPCEDAEFCYASTLNELKEYAKNNNAIIIPHHVGYREGWRGLNWKEFDGAISPVVEIFSEHGNSLESSSHFGMYSHSMGGVDSSQSALHQLKTGKRFGLIACTDDHYGYPGGYGTGITAVMAEKLDRGSIFEAIRNRHTYAATGDRIELEFNLNEGIMGDCVECAEFADIGFSVEGRDKLQSLEIYKNGELFSQYSEIDFKRQPPLSNRHLLKVEWGWDMIASKNITRWNIKIRSDNGVIENVVPAFCGGAASTTEKNTLAKIDESTLSISSYTSRKNVNPVNSVSFFLNGDLNTTIDLNFECELEGDLSQQKITLTKEKLATNDFYKAAFERFSSPKLKVHQLISSNDYRFNGQLVDEKTKSGDFYFLKATQKNGHMAWTSPIWINDARDLKEG